MDINLFFSWQTETDAKCNKGLIWTALQEAADKLNKESPNICIKLTQGMRNVPGSPSPADECIRKAKECDIFVADLTVANISCDAQGEERFHINNNVAIEYGAAMGASGLRTIIGVRNDAFGSAEECELPFDMKYLRWPVNYTYRPTDDEAARKTAKKGLVDDLVEALRPVRKYVAESKESKWLPAINWYNWNEYTDSQAAFVPFGAYETLKQQLQTKSNSNTIENLTIYIKGLSGIGKTFMVFNAFKFLGGAFCCDVLYYKCGDCDNPKTEVRDLCTKLIKDGNRHFLVLDNCPYSVFTLAMERLKRKGHKTHLICIAVDVGKTPNDNNGVISIDINKSDVKGIVEKIIDDRCTRLDSSLKSRITRMCDNIPMMASLFVDAVESGGDFKDVINDETLMDKLLGDEVDNEERRILQALSLFNRVGFDEEKREQLEFIINNKLLTVVPETSKYTAAIGKFKKRQIIEKVGRYLRVRPFPLAVYLAKGWIENNKPYVLDLVKDVIGAGELCLSFIESFENMGFSSDAQAIVEGFVKEYGPFDVAELLNFEVGSRFFRSFADVNPVAVSGCLSRNIGKMSFDERMNLVNGRRNLVWALEHLCFRCETFKESAWTLLLLAEAENENGIGNNATGVLTQLFCYVSNTEANLTDKLEVIKQVASDAEERHRSIGIKCMERAIHDVGVIWGYPGAQGLETLPRYEPKTWAEVGDYFNNVIALLYATAIEQSKVAKQAIDVIAVSSLDVIGFAVRYRLMDTANKMLSVFEKTIAVMDDDEKEKARSILYDSVNFLANRFDNRTLCELQRLLKTLTPNTFAFEYEFYIGKGGLEDEEIVEDKSGEKIKTKMHDIAKKLSSIIDTVDYALFYKGQQIMTYAFAPVLYDAIKDDNDKVVIFVEHSMQTIRQIKVQERRISLFTSFVGKMPIENRLEVLKSFESDDALKPSLLRLASDVDFGDNMTLLNRLCDDELINMDDLTAKRHGCDAIYFSSVDDIKASFARFMEKGTKGYEVVINFMYTLSVWDVAKTKLLLGEWKDAVNGLGVSALINGGNNKGLIVQSVEVLLNALPSNEGAEFATFVFGGMIGAMSAESIFISRYDYMVRVFKLLCGKYFDAVWPRLKDALETKDDKAYIYLSLMNILGSRISTLTDESSLLFHDDSRYQRMIDDCKRSSGGLLAKRLASMCPAVELEYPYKSDTLDETPSGARWGEFAKMLIDNFGDDRDVLDAIAANMENVSWKGNFSKYYELRLAMFAQMQDNKNRCVREWARDEMSLLNEAIRKTKQEEEEELSL